MISQVKPQTKQKSQPGVGSVVELEKQVLGRILFLGAPRTNMTLDFELEQRQTTQRTGALSWDKQKDSLQCLHSWRLLRILSRKGT